MPIGKLIGRILNMAIKDFYNRAFSKFLTTQISPAPNTSLTDFFLQDVLSFVSRTPLRILELGCGASSLFSAVNLGHEQEVFAIDFSDVAITYAQHFNQHSNIHYFCYDLLLPQDLKKLSQLAPFEIVLDAHFLHCVAEEGARQFFLQTLASMMPTGGIFAMECLLTHSRMEFSDYFLFNPESGILYQQLEQEALAVRWIPDIPDIERLFSSCGFSIDYLVAVAGAHVSVDGQEATPFDPALARVIVKKVSI